ncbi:MAG: diaminopimelate epimerase [Rhabdochlamydiaceae bacterium]|jgi:diaminopimelate epimerase
MILFAKYHGAGNDFILIDDQSETFPVSNHNFIQSVCQRQTGIGADGLILLQKSEKADARARFFNSDGKEVALCGNGLRCLVDFAYQLERIGAKSTLETNDRLVACEWNDGEITVDIGPYTWLHPLSFESLDIQVVNTGVPHAVAFVEDHTQFSMAPQIRSHASLGMEGANVNFAVLTDNKLHVRTYERGVEGETQACGTGAAAVAVAAQKKYHLPNPITIVPRSGEELKVDVSPASLRLTGKATFVFHGSFQSAN